MKLLSATISRLARFRNAQIEHWKNNPLVAQREVLQDLLTHGQYTDIGSKYNLSRLSSASEFKKSMPLFEYETLQPFIDRQMNGEENVLWNTPSTWFAKSSGTTSNRSKFIPITKESLEKCHYQAAKDILTLYYVSNPESELLSGKSLVIGGSHQVNALHENIKYGDLSAVLLQNSPFWGHWLRTPELSIALLDEWEQKIKLLADASINENVTSIAGVPTWTTILIKYILGKTGKKNLREVWPNLELYMHGGVAFPPYKEHFSTLIGTDVRYLDMYNASEGFFAAQDNPNEEGMLLFLQHGIFYEFMPMEEYGKSEPQTLSLEEVELNKNYALIITTNGGLWRYIVGDTIQFTTRYPFKIRVSGRIKHFINAFGEEVIVDNADKAITYACEATEAIVSNYTAAPIFFKNDGVGAHEWLIEFEKKPYDLILFTKLLDAELQKINSDYEAKRHKNIALKLPTVQILPTGSFAAWLKSKGKLGGQHKVPRLCNERIYVDEIQSFLKRH